MILFLPAILYLAGYNLSLEQAQCMLQQYANVEHIAAYCDFLGQRYNYA